MKQTYNNNSFKKVILPVFVDLDPSLGLRFARAITQEKSILLTGMVNVEGQDALSAGVTRAQNLRCKLREIQKGTKLKARSSVAVSDNLWHELHNIIAEEKPDLLVLEYPHHLEFLKKTPQELFEEVNCDIAMVRGPFPQLIRKILVPIRGGPHSELALRITLAASRITNASTAWLHVLPDAENRSSEAPFRGISRVLNNLPEIQRIEITHQNADEAIIETAGKFDLVVMGSTSRPYTAFNGLGKITDTILEQCPTGVVIVKTSRQINQDPEKEMIGSQAISILVDRWFAENTYHSNEFEDLDELLQLKRARGLTISVALPALNEEETVGKVIHTIKGELMDRVPLIDEIVLIDSNSTDDTRKIAESLGVPVYIHQDILPQYGQRTGKGEALWKSLFVTQGDIILWIDTDIVNIHPRFIYGLVGPLLIDPRISFVKGFYRRPIKVGERVLAGGGGRVTELTARPLLNLFFPELSGVIQPLSGEYGGHRSLLEQLPFFSGYGVEIGLLIDVFKKCGLDCLAQVDLQKRIHHNQPLEALSKMSFAIIQAVTRKLDIYHGYSVLEDVNLTMKLIRYETGRLYLNLEEIAELERPPMVSLPEYQSKRKL